MSNRQGRAMALKYGSHSPLRLRVNLPLRIQPRGDCAFDVWAKQISSGEFRLHTGFRISPGTRVRVKGPHVASQYGTVTWSDRDNAAVALDQPLHILVLCHLAAQYARDAIERPLDDMD